MGDRLLRSMWRGASMKEAVKQLVSEKRRKAEGILSVEEGRTASTNPTHTYLQSQSTTVPTTTAPSTRRNPPGMVSQFMTFMIGELQD